MFCVCNTIQIANKGLSFELVMWSPGRTGGLDFLLVLRFPPTRYMTQLWTSVPRWIVQVFFWMVVN